MFKNLLDQPGIYTQYDSLRIYDSIVGFKNQIEQTWLEVNQKPLPDHCNLAKNVVIAGMGGSALGGRIIRSLDQYILNVPMEVVTNYRLPAYIDKHSLVILSSYSGNTEETISCAHDALSRGAQVYCIATGGKLMEMAKMNKLSHFQIDAKFNPSNQPRMGLGYSVIAQFALLARCGFINFEQKDVEQIGHLLEKLYSHYRKELPTEKNAAKQIAEKLKNQVVIFFSANHLVGTAHAIKNMINENSKTFSTTFDLPELNHHLLEGLSFPKSFRDCAHFLLIASDQYPAVIRRRLEITKDILKKHGYQYTVIKPESAHPTLQVFETLYFGEYVSYYLGLLHRIDPGPIPSVDYLKKELAKI